MKLGDSNFITISIVAGVVLSLNVQTKYQASAANFNLDAFPVPVGMYMNSIWSAFDSQG